jgi:hypothetical protein
VISSGSVLGLVSYDRAFCTMAAPLFGKDWVSKPDEAHTAAYNEFQVAVKTARSSSDEGIKKVSSFFN